MKKIIAIGINTFREAIRNKVLYSLVFFAVAVIIASLAFGALSVNEEARLTTDLGLGGMSSFLVLIATFVGVNLLYKELERKTVYTLIPKPIHRYQFVLGKFTGLVATLVVLLLMMSSVLLLVLLLQGAPLRPQLSMMVCLIFFEVLVITAVAVLFSSFSTPFLSGLFTIGVFLVGRSVPDIRMVAGNLEQPVLPELLQVVTRVVPNLRFFYVTGTELHGEHISVHGTFIDWGYVGMAGGYAAFYLAALLMIAIALFARRDFV